MKKSDCEVANPLACIEDIVKDNTRGTALHRTHVQVGVKRDIKRSHEGGETQRPDRSLAPAKSVCADQKMSESITDERGHQVKLRR
jgi:hypothetical protein